jgi:uncharacterized protein (DUF362 family)
VDASFTQPNPAETRVAIVQSTVPTAAAIDQAEINRMVTDAVNLAGGFMDLIHDGQTVVVKPNLVAPHDFTNASSCSFAAGTPLAPTVNGVTTDYRVTAAVVALVRTLNPNGIVYVMEGSGHGGPTGPVMTQLNYAAAYIPGVTEFVAIESDSALAGGMVTVTNPNPQIWPTLTYNAKYLNADVIISVATLKSHWNAVITGGVKNLGIGATPGNHYGTSASVFTRMGGTNSPDHESVYLHHWIADYYAAKPAGYVIIDGLQGIQNGPVPACPVSGTTNLAQDQMNMRIIMAGRDGVAVDTVESLVMGWDPMSVTYLTDLHTRGIGTMEMANIRVVGSRVDQVRRAFAGVLDRQAFGGAMVTDATPPPVTVLGAQASGPVLTISIQPDADLKRVEVYVDGAIVEPPVVAGFDAITLNVSGLAPGPHSVDILGFDASLNATVTSVPGGITVQ